jgi:uncharacterized protein (TIGR00255 family)
MVKSMTGYGMAKGPVGSQTITVEIRSLNSKFLELNLRLPSAYRDKELELRNDLGKQIDRGKADVNINYENNELAKRNTVNRDIFKAYAEELKSVCEDFQVSDSNLLDIILRMPSVMNTEKAEGDEQSWLQLKALMQQAIIQFNSFRETEGKVLENDICLRIKAIENAIPVLETYEQARIDAVRQRIQKGLSEIREQNTVDQNRFEQELIYYIEKLDISEEKVRLRSHCEYFMQTIAAPDANGKKLGFITQEIGREINTIGAKANDAIMQRTVVEMKDELEKLKEQLANVL